MGELVFKSDQWDQRYKRPKPYRPYQPLELRWEAERDPHLLPEKAELSRLPDGLPDQVIRAIEGFVLDAKEYGFWFCVKDGDLHDDQDLDILTAAAFVNEQGFPFIVEYRLHMTPGFYGPSIELMRTLCLEGYRNLTNDNF